MTRHPICRALTAALLILLSGCPFAPPEDDCRKRGDCPCTGDDCFDQSTVAGLMKLVELSYEGRDIDRFRDLFDPSEYRFEFAQVDRDRDPTIPTEWDYHNEMQSTERLFDDDTVDRVVLNFNRAEPVPARAEDQLPGGPAGVLKVVLTSVHLEVHTVNELGEPLELLVDGDGAEFFVRSFPNQSSPGGVEWRVIRWRDKPIGGLSLGLLKRIAATE